MADVTPAVALTIAGSDSGGGAGLQADLRTFAAHGVHGATVVTAVTAQNTNGVFRVDHLPAASVVAQLQAVLDDLGVAAVKTGFLARREIVLAVAEFAAHRRLPALVVDPVLVNSAGEPIVDDATIDAYRENLLPHALVATPNLAEAALLAHRRIATRAEMAEVAAEIAALGPHLVIVKGGALAGEAVDVVWHEGATFELVEARIPTVNNHGTGCSLAAAVAARLALGADVESAVRAAKRFVTTAIDGAADWKLGSGRGPINHLGWT